MQKTARKTGSEAAPVSRLPAHETIYRQLRALVLFGDLAPGQAVTIQGLCERLGAGMTPVREALRRLIAEGALELQGNRRVSVPLLDAGHVGELIFARQWLDPHLAERATARASMEDLRALTAIDNDLDRAILRGDMRGYLELNYRFHRRIYELADAPILADVADGLWLRFGPSLRVVCGRVGTQGLPDKHKDLLAAMRARDHQAAAEAIRADVVQGMEQVRQSLARAVRAD
ncbi:GntR family transcriptional regulator [Roseovarius autotrophicus]|uniref:GntR family transcriptional regulator n=1 Tax=Roseovarius autotrophicus TaxID=2824121 RepID=UPI0019F80EB7|nr:GntR family transcriptional regulator [Roseovarius autotrophicus]MBE0452961.1 GntR family transcriptional regulator [Roseovarius sp.]